MGTAVEGVALRPERARNPGTFELPIADSYPAVVLEYRPYAIGPEQTNVQESTTRNKSVETTTLLLFSHEVQRGQSGAPILDPKTREVVGLIEGRWLHPSGGSLGADGARMPLELTQGAAVPISYALDLLEQKSVQWSLERPR